MANYGQDGAQGPVMEMTELMDKWLADGQDGAQGPSWPTRPCWK